MHEGVDGHHRLASLVAIDPANEIATGNVPDEQVEAVGGLVQSPIAQAIPRLLPVLVFAR
jgi:Mg2+/Co2+ transporter CorC